MNGIKGGTLIFLFKRKTAYEISAWLEFRRCSSDLAWQQMVLSPGGACGLLSPMKEFLFLLAMAVVLVGCGGGDSPPDQSAAAETPKPALADRQSVV